MRIKEIINKKRRSKGYMPPANPRAQRQHKAQLELSKRYVEKQEALVDLKLNKQKFENEGAKTVSAMADRARKNQPISR